jgi:NADH dehydrogenase [ubiquinone] 1 alpha subcomplex assembly factor 7
VADLARAAEAGDRPLMRAMRQAEPERASLAARLAARIATDGPLSVEDYMQACLLDAGGGAYASRQPIGRQGDFITAPEISQIFGELLGLWAVAVWQSMGEPGSITIAELGPGRGTLIADALRAWRGSPRFVESVAVALVEASPVMAEAQRTTLRAAPVPLSWYASLDDVPQGPLIVLANEFIDALPIRQFIRRGPAWRERLVATDGKTGFAFTVGAAVAPPDPALTKDARPAPEGAIVETRPGAERLLAELRRRAAAAPLAALLIDYGHTEQGFGDTLQAVRSHRFADPLTAPGQADLSAHVDFAALKASAEELGLRAYGPLPQGEFLLKLGLGERRERLLEGASSAQAAAIGSGAARLVDPAQMGVLFKALALTSAGLAPPPPFAFPHFTLSSGPSW